MSRAQDRGSGSGLQGGQDAEDAQQTAGATGTGTTAGARATGVTGTAAATGTTTTTTRTTTGMQERGAAPSATYGRSTEPTTAYRAEPDQEAGQDSMMGGVFTILAGLLTFFGGLAAVVRSHFYPTLGGYAYRLNVHTWGWILLALGAVMFAVGACALLGMAWARAAGVGLAVLTAIGSFLFLPYSPVWGTILLLVSVVAIWGLLRGSGRQEF
jgi:hypothetical protein